MSAELVRNCLLFYRPFSCCILCSQGLAKPKKTVLKILQKNNPTMIWVPLKVLKLKKHRNSHNHVRRKIIKGQRKDFWNGHNIPAVSMFVWLVLFFKLFWNFSPVFSTLTGTTSISTGAIITEFLIVNRTGRTENTQKEMTWRFSHILTYFWFRVWFQTMFIEVMVLYL